MGTGRQEVCQFDLAGPQGKSGQCQEALAKHGRVVRWGYSIRLSIVVTVIPPPCVFQGYY
jgi:hypothetical protein